MKADEVIIPAMTAQFKRAAIVYHWGYEYDDARMQFAGKKSAEEAISALDTCKDGRLALVPYLDDPDPSVRVMAAGYLVKVMPERALAVLKELDERCMTRAHMTAFWFLQRHENGTDL
jgi:hypothetical protein